MWARPICILYLSSASRFLCASFIPSIHQNPFHLKNFTPLNWNCDGGGSPTRLPLSIRSPRHGINGVKKIKRGRRDYPVDRNGAKASISHRGAIQCSAPHGAGDCKPGRIRVHQGETRRGGCPVSRRCPAMSPGRKRSPGRIDTMSEINYLRYRIAVVTRWPQSARQVVFLAGIFSRLARLSGVTTLPVVAKENR